MDALRLPPDEVEGTIAQGTGTGTLSAWHAFIRQKKCSCRDGALGVRGTFGAATDPAPLYSKELRRRR